MTVPAIADPGYHRAMRQALPESAITEAEDWAARLADAARPLTGAERQALEAWCRADPARVALLDHYNAIWDDPALLQAMATPPVATRRRGLLRGAGAAAALGLAGWIGRAPLDRALADAASGPGEIRAVPLPGANGGLLLDTASAIDLAPGHLHLRAGALRLELSPQADAWRLTGGALDGEAAPGCLLVLRRDPGLDRLSVLRGRLRIAGLGIEAGQGLAWTGGPPRAHPLAHPLGAAERDAAEGFAQAWRLFEGTPLAEVAAELERYLPGPLLVAGGIAGLRVSGRFRFGQPQRVLEILASTLPLRVQRVGGLVVRLVGKD